MPELKPCPWCSGEIRIITHTICTDGKYYYASCINNNCDVQPYSKILKPKKRVVEAWNKRK